VEQGAGDLMAEMKFDDLFNDSTGQLQRAIEFNNKDVRLALAMKLKQIDVKSFDFDGAKYDVEDGEMIAEQLRREVTEQRKQQLELDKKAFLFFVRESGLRRQELVAAYREFQQVKRQYDEFVKIVNSVIEKVRPFYGGTIGIDAVERIVRELRAKEEVDLKAAYRKLLADGRFGDQPLRVRVQDFIDGEYAYFTNRKYVKNEVEDMKALAIQVAGDLNEYQFAVYKQMLEVQLDIASPGYVL
jgi:hypothetical protein